MSPNKDLELSIVVVGDSQCGKTQLINKFQNFNFSKVINALPKKIVYFILSIRISWKIYSHILLFTGFQF